MIDSRSRVDDAAVSPVIGIILMVAVTVILAAVIGAFVLNVGQGVDNNPPKMAWEFQFDSEYTGTFDGQGDGDLTDTDDAIRITARAGEQIDAETTVKVGDQRVDGSSDLAYDSGGISLPIVAGEEIVVEETGSADVISPGARVFVIYQPDKPELRAIVGETEVS